nr:hypothetical protein POPTR_006G189700 [Ipomoea batatas]
MASEAAKLMLHCVFAASIPLSDTEIERRPYHRNCGCALHALKSSRADICSHRRTISFPKKQTRTDNNNALSAGKLSLSAISRLSGLSA